MLAQVKRDLIADALREAIDQAARAAQMLCAMDDHEREATAAAAGARLENLLADFTK